MNRRDLLKSLMAISGALSINPVIANIINGSAGSEEQFFPHLQQLAQRIAATRSVDPELQKRLHHTLTHQPTEANAVLNRQIASDFADENVICIDGWILSKTEANLCVLLSCA